MKFKILGLTLVFAHIASIKEKTNGSVDVNMANSITHNIPKEAVNEFMEAYEKWALEKTVNGILGNVDMLIEKGEAIWNKMRAKAQEIIEEEQGVPMDSMPLNRQFSINPMYYQAGELQRYINRTEAVLAASKPLKEHIKKVKAFLKQNAEKLAADKILCNEMMELEQAFETIIYPQEEAQPEETKPNEENA